MRGGQRVRKRGKQELGLPGYLNGQVDAMARKSCGSRSELGEGKVSNSVVASGRKHGRHVNSVTWVQNTEKELASVDTQVSLATKRLENSRNF